MSRFATLIAATLLLLGACIHRAMPPVEVKTPPTAVSYLADVEPILEKRCVVCHSCYNAPCQLKLSSYEGLDRGGSKAPVYSGSRLRPQAPTRLFIDAQTTGKWRTKKFHSVTDNSADPGFNNSLMLHLLDAKMRNPRSTGDYHPEATDLTCAANTRELSTFLDRPADTAAVRDPRGLASAGREGADAQRAVGSDRTFARGGARDREMGDILESGRSQACDDGAIPLRALLSRPPPLRGNRIQRVL
jgi:hypothetical protein